MTNAAESWQNSNIDFKIGIDSAVSRKAPYPLDCGVLIFYSPSSALFEEENCASMGGGHAFVGNGDKRA
jgi:hypothetical protein